MRGAREMWCVSDWGLSCARDPPLLEDDRHSPARFDDSACTDQCVNASYLQSGTSIKLNPCVLTNNGL